MSARILASNPATLKRPPNAYPPGTVMSALFSPIATDCSWNACENLAKQSGLAPGSSICVGVQQLSVFSAATSVAVHSGIKPPTNGDNSQSGKVSICS